MTEGILGRSGAPSLRVKAGRHGFTRLHAMVLSRRYAAACKRASRMANLSRFLSNTQAMLAAVGLAAMPVRYAMADAAVSVAGYAAMLADAIEDMGGRAWEGARDVAARFPSFALKGRRMRAAGLCVLAAAAVFAFTTAMYATGLEVVMDGQPAGYVTSQNQVENAIGNVAGRVSDILGHPYVMQPDVRYRVTVVRRNQIFDQAQFERQLFQSVGAVKMLNVLMVDGAPVGALSAREELDGVLGDILARYPLTGDGDTVAFAQDVKIETRYADAALETASEDLLAELTREVRPAVYARYSRGEGLNAFCGHNGIARERLEMLNPDMSLDALQGGESLLIQGALPFLSVARGHPVSYEVEVAFETEYKENSSLYKGEERVITGGVPGRAIVMAEEMNLDGQIVGTNELSRTITQAPVTQVVERGTKVKYALGKYTNPLASGRLSSPYGYRTGGFHQGIDLAAPKNTTIVAADGGKVIFTGWMGTYGKLVIIQHSSSQKTLYAHCNSFLVKPGQMVAQGDPIAKVGTTGHSTGYHLHFEIRINNQTVNPAKYIKIKK